MKIIKLIKANKVFVFPILSGILLILAYPPFDLSFLIFIALIPLFLFLNSKISFKKAFLGGFLVGILFFGKLFSWFFATYPFEWLGITGQKDTILVFVLVGFIWLVQTIFLGLFIGAFAWFCKYLIQKIKLGYFLIIIPFLWIILEYLRACGFGILWLGKESFLGPHWTFGNLAYVLHNRTILIQLADLGGIYLISFLIVLVNILLFLILKQCWKLSPAYRQAGPAYRQAGFQHCAVLLGILILIGISWSVYGTYKINQQESLVDNNKKIALVQTNFLSSSEFNPYSKKEVFDIIIELFKDLKNIKENPDIIIEPEGFGIINLTKSKKITKHLLGKFYKPNQVFLENKKVVVNDKAKSRLFFHNLEEQEPIGFHDKLLLVPGGDYLPYWIKLLLNIYSFNTNYEKRLYAKGEKVEPILISLNKDTIKIGGTICSSIVSPDIQRKMTKKGAQFLIVISSDAPFHGSKLLLSQNLAMSKLRAVENRRYFAQATNMGHSFLLNSKGEIKAKTKELGNKILFSKAKIINKKTLYTKFGDWIILIAGIVIFLGLIFRTKLSTLKN